MSFEALKRARLDKGRWTRKSSQIPYVKGPCIAHRSTVYGSRNSSFSGQHRREQMHTDESASDESSSGMRSLRLIVCSVCIWKRQSPFEDPLAGQSLPQALVLAEHFRCPCRDGMDHLWFSRKTQNENQSAPDVRPRRSNHNTYPEKSVKDYRDDSDEEMFITSTSPALAHTTFAVRIIGNRESVIRSSW